MQRVLLTVCGNVKIDTLKREVKLQLVVGNVNKSKKKKLKILDLRNEKMICLVLSQSRSIYFNF